MCCAVEEATQQAVSSVHQGNGPYLLECRSYRFRAHSMHNPHLDRTAEEVATWKQQDPILTPERRLHEHELGWLTDDAQQVEDAIAPEIDDAVALAETGPWEPSRRPGDGGLHVDFANQPVARG